MLLKAEYFQKNDDTCFSDLHRSNLKILTPKQVLQRLPIALAQVKAGNTSYILCIKQIKLLIKKTQESCIHFFQVSHSVN